MHSDERLIERIRRKQDREAAELLIRRYYKDIYAFVYRQTGERELAMDLTQEIFLQILKGICSFDPKKSGFRTWAYRIAAHKVTDYYRSRAYRQSRLEKPFGNPEEGHRRGRMRGASTAREKDEAMTPDTWSYADYGAAERDLSELMVQREQIAQVMAVVAHYDGEWVRIFQMKCFGEMTFAQIAAELGISANTVKTRFYQMLRQIRREVSED